MNIFKLEDDWVVFFDLFSKNGNGDSIKPIAEELKKRKPNMRFFFCTNKKNHLQHIDMADEIITEKSMRFNYVCSKAKYIISPIGYPNKGKKRKGQIFIQTWHGSPIKKLYLSKDKTKSKYIKYANTFKNTDLFCNQGNIHTDKLMEAFNLKETQIASTGLPRNDILFNATEEFKRKIKQDLGLPLDKKVIFYCPTWRRYDYKMELMFDINKFKQALSKDYVLLIRSHVGKHNWINSNGEKIEIFDNKFSFDGGIYPEATHLYLISDILISDYSSTVFDFAITQKPQILYTYDYDNYSQEFGLYYDYKDFAPCPNCKDQDSLLEEILNIDKFYDVYGEKYKKFREQYLEFEKGNASKQIIDFMFK